MHAHTQNPKSLQEKHSKASDAEHELSMLWPVVFQAGALQRPDEVRDPRYRFAGARRTTYARFTCSLGGTQALGRSDGST